MMNMFRYWTICLILAGTASLLHYREGPERQVARELLSNFPRELSGWTATDQPIDAETLRVLGAGDFLSRVYSMNESAAPISLFIGYFPTQRTGTTIHSPKNCLPASGWAFESSSTVMLEDVAGKTHRIGEFVIANEDNRQFVIYWYEAHGRSVSNEYMAKIYLVSDAIRMNRTDGALLRVITPIRSSGELSEAKLRAEAFVRELFPALPRFIPD
jgi:EpsI family protein